MTFLFVTLSSFTVDDGAAQCTSDPSDDEDSSADDGAESGVPVEQQQMQGSNSIYKILLATT